MANWTTENNGLAAAVREESGGARRTAEAATDSAATGSGAAAAASGEPGCVFFSDLMELHLLHCILRAGLFVTTESGDRKLVPSAEAAVTRDFNQWYRTRFVGLELSPISTSQWKWQFFQVMAMRDSAHYEGIQKTEQFPVVVAVEGEMRSLLATYSDLFTKEQIRMLEVGGSRLDADAHAKDEMKRRRLRVSRLRKREEDKRRKTIQSASEGIDGVSFESVQTGAAAAAESEEKTAGHRVQHTRAPPRTGEMEHPAPNEKAGAQAEEEEEEDADGGGGEPGSKRARVVHYDVRNEDDLSFVVSDSDSEMLRSASLEEEEEVDAQLSSSGGGDESDDDDGPEEGSTSAVCWPHAFQAAPKQGYLAIFCTKCGQIHREDA
jgi:hypothetical protein